MLTIFLNKLFLINVQTQEEDGLLEEIAQANSLSQLEALFPRIPQIKTFQEAYTARKMALQQEYEGQVIQEIKQANTIEQLQVIYPRVQTNPRLSQIYINCMHELFEESSLLKTLNGATCVQEFEEILNRIPQNPRLLAVYNSRLSEFRGNLREEYFNLKQRITAFIDHNGEMVSDESLLLGIRRQIPPNTYLRIRISNLASYQFAHECTQARKIELIREECGFGRVIEACFSACFVTNSIYRQSYSDNTLMKGILASSDIIGNPAVYEDFTQQVRIAYWTGYKIEIILPLKLTEEGVVHLTSSFKSLSLSISAGRWVRRLVTES